MSMKNSNDTIGIQTRDLPACSAVPQPNAPPAACPISLVECKIKKKCKHNRIAKKIQKL
jgi:hypothetical protein